MVVWLREAMDAAQRDAEAADAVDPAPWTVEIGEAGSPERPRPGAPGTSAGMIKDAQGDDLWECEGTETLCMTSASAKHAARHDPAAVLRRIAADRKTLDDCMKAVEVARRYKEDDPSSWSPWSRLAYRTIRNLAEAWGWTEETT